MAARIRRMPESEAIYVRALYGDPCAYCGGPGGTVDHITPSARRGRNHWTNYTAACVECNRRKGAVPLLRLLLGA